MALPPGSHLGPFEILGSLGAGGMGEVYRARDTRLGREVAVKVLPEEYTADAECLQRFEIEARAASALNHPNIVTVYQIGREGDVPYIAMELVVGQTVRELLRDRPSVGTDCRRVRRSGRQRESIEGLSPSLCG